MRSPGRPIAVRVEEMSYLQLQQVDDSAGDHAYRRYWKGHYFTELTNDAIRALLLRGTVDGSGEHLPSVSLQAHGGAIADVPDADSAFSHRDAQFEYVAAARWNDRTTTSHGSPPPGSVAVHSIGSPAGPTSTPWATRDQPASGAPTPPRSWPG